MDSSSAAHLSVPYNERWGILKEVIVRLYMEENKKLKEIVEIMKINYQFYASEPQYKRQFKTWKIAKALPSKKKDKIIKALETRAQQGKTSMVLHKDKDNALNKVRRYMKEQMRRDLYLGSELSNNFVPTENLSGHALQCGSKVFMNWNMPAEVLTFLNSKARLDHLSPSVPADSPISGVVVATPRPAPSPSASNILSPGQAESPRNEVSAVDESIKANRAILFVQGRHSELFRGMKLDEQIATTDWMHQFWQFAFRTARTWGRGPSWNSTNLAFNDFLTMGHDNLPGTPMNTTSPSQYSRAASLQHDAKNKSHLPCPSGLCLWSIHYREVKYEHKVEIPVSGGVIDDPEHEDTWKPWASPGTINEFANKMALNLETNDFSKIQISDLPISVGQIIKAVKRSPEQLLEEAFGFSIMARNADLVFDMFTRISNIENFSFDNLYPLHLAASYLNGAKSCCNIFGDLVMNMSTGHIHVRKLYTNHLGHTVLDSLMISILKSHTSCSPVLVDEAFKKEHRFAGEEVDTCGRWDADSDCVRILQGRGHPTIPRDWKHMFCHTSVQAITHCIGTLFSPHWAPDINTPSGIFVKRCPGESCGLKLQPNPLHTLVITAVYLAQFGSEGENLFGMLACLLCLLGKGANPLLPADISLMAFLNGDSGTECTHSEMTPLQLAQQVPTDTEQRWPQECRTGWKIFCAVLKLSQDEWAPQEPLMRARDVVSDGPQSTHWDFLFGSIDDGFEGRQSPSNSTEDNEGDAETKGDLPTFCEYHSNTSFQKNFFRKNKTLASLWAAVQTELLTYRRITIVDPWISVNFDMKSVLESLIDGRPLGIRLVAEEMMKEFCRCGIFYDSEDVACLRVEEASRFYFSNLEDWNRTTFLDAEFDRHEAWDGW